MQLFGNSAYGKTVTNKKKLFQLLMVMKIIILKKLDIPHFTDLEKLYGQKYDETSMKREMLMDLLLQT